MLDRWRTRLTAGGVGLTVVALAWVSGLVPAPVVAGSVAPALPVGHDTGLPTTDAFWLATPSGALYPFGVPSYGAPTSHLNQPLVGMTATGDQQGYWMVASDGGVFSYGDAHFFGSTGNIHLNRPIVGLTPTTEVRGYWLVASDGGVFTFGNGVFYGSTGNIHLNQPIVGMAPTPDGRGTGWWPRTAGCSPSGTPSSTGPLGTSTSTSPSWAWPRPPTAGVLAGGRGRRRVHLRGRRLLRVDGQLPGRPGGTTRRHAVGPRLLGGAAERHGHPLRGRRLRPPPQALLLSPATPGDRAVLFAFQQLGKPYIWGGNGPVGYDCSGLASPRGGTAPG